MYSQPKIKRALPRAIEYELKHPGEFGNWLTYTSILAAWKTFEKDRKGKWNNEFKPELENEIQRAADRVQSASVS